MSGTPDIVERLRKPDFWRAGFHGGGRLSEQNDLAPFLAAETIAELVEVLEQASFWLEGRLRQKAMDALSKARGEPA